MQETKDAQAGAPRTQNVPEQGSVAVLIPCYNEAVTIGKVVDDFSGSCPRRPSTCTTTTPPTARRTSRGRAGPW
ncbi:MAG: hypothetical protein V8S24_13505 [Gordonibacter pamelaeae]